LQRDRYQVWCRFTQKDGTPVSNYVAKKVKNTIKKHSSVDEFGFAAQGQFGENLLKKSKKTVYQVTIKDKGYSQGAARILSRVKGALIYPHVVMPVSHEVIDGKKCGVENVNIFIEDDKTYEACLMALKQDKNIRLLDLRCKSIATSSNYLFTSHPHFYNTFLDLSQEDYDLLTKTIGSDNRYPMKALTEEQKFLDLIRRGGPLLFKFVEIVSGLVALKEVYEIVKALQSTVN